MMLLTAMVLLNAVGADGTDAPVASPARAPEMRISLSHARLLWEREALLEEVPELGGPVVELGASTLLAGLSVGAFALFADGGSFGHIAAAPILLLPLLLSAALLVGHVLFGIAGTVSMTNAIRQRNTREDRLSALQREIPREVWR